MTIWLVGLTISDSILEVSGSIQSATHITEVVLVRGFIIMQMQASMAADCSVGFVGHNVRHGALVRPGLELEVPQRHVVVNRLDIVGQNLAVGHLVRISCSRVSRAEARRCKGSRTT